MSIRSMTRLAIMTTTIGLLAACQNYVEREEYDTRNAAVDGRLGKLESRLDALEADLQQRFAKYDAQIASFEGKVRVDLTTHFAFGAAELEAGDQPPLEEFAQVIKTRYPEALVTVEGFTDPAGSPRYNQSLGLRRAKTVSGYLMAQGLGPDQVRTVSYGEARNCQVQPGATGERGRLNRRVVLVIDRVNLEG